MNETTDATAIFAPLWRRKWLILAVGIVVAAASYAYYKGKTPVYMSSTQVYLGAASEEQAPGERAGTKSTAINVGNQAQLIDSIVIEHVRKQLRAEHKAALIAGSTVRAKSTEKSQFITISVESHSATGGALFSNLIAQSYIKRQNATRERGIENAIAIARRQLRRIEAQSAPKPAAKTTSTGKTKAPAAAPTVSSTTILQTAALNSKINQLESSLNAAGPEQIKPAKAETAVMLSPKPRKNAIFGFVIGIVLAAIAAYVLSRFDRRLRSLPAIEAAFQTQILAGFPKVKRPIVEREGKPTPSRFLLESLRRLHTSMQMGAISGEQRATRARVVLFVSADPGDGKSTLIADLALVQRDAGGRVAVIEANFRRPAQARLLGLDGEHGLAEVLEGTLPIEQAMRRARPTQPSALADPPGSQAGIATAVESRGTGSLVLLAGGGDVPNPPALLERPATADLLRSVSENFDYVLIDAPSPLEVSDVMPLLNLVDGIVIVARVGHTREMSAERLVQLLAQTRAPVLGAVANCVPRKEIERYGFSVSNGRVSPSKLIGR
jgi:Mrp family chromosome partitioning ATPase